MPTESELATRQRETRNAIANDAEFIKRQFRRVIKRYTDEVKAALSRGLSDASTETLVTIRNQLRLGESLQRILIDAGFEDFVSDYVRNFAIVEKQAAEYFREFNLPATFSDISIRDLDVLLNNYETQLREFVDERLVRPLRNGILQTNLAARSPEQVRAQVDALIDRHNITTQSGRRFTDSQIETMIDDSYARYDSQVRAVKAEALGFEIYQYFGPMDPNTRPACRRMLTINRHGVPGMLYRDEITTDLHPDLRFDPLVARGGFNCRHDWTPVSREYAEQQGFRF